MKISSDDTYWQQLGAHSSAPVGGSAPMTVQLRLAALIGDCGIDGSVSHYDTRRPGSTVWAVLVVTDDGRLIQVVMEYDSEQYDSYAEQQPRNQSHPTNHTVHAAWVRRLGDASGLHMPDVWRRRNTFNEPLSAADLGSITVVFADDVPVVVDLTDLRRADQHDRVDAFVAAVRKHSRL